MDKRHDGFGSVNLNSHYYCDESYGHGYGVTVGASSLMGIGHGCRWTENHSGIQGSRFHLDWEGYRNGSGGGKGYCDSAGRGIG